MIAAACIVVAALIVLVSLETAGWALLVGRYKRRREFTNLIVSLPPVPDTDRDWLSVWTLEDIEQESYDRDFFAMPLVADDMRNAW